jgi:hypothetical protein
MRVIRALEPIPRSEASLPLSVRFNALSREPGWIAHRAPGEAPSPEVERRRVTVEYTKRYADTGGWGYYNFNHHEPKAPTAKLRPKSDARSATWRARRRTRFGPNSIHCWTNEIVNECHRFTNTGNSAMRIVRVLGVGLAGLFAIGAVTAYGQINTRSQYGGTTAAVVDNEGNLRVPSDYRTAYHMLGSRAVAKTTVRGQSSCTWSMHRPELSPHIARTDTFPMAPFFRHQFRMAFMVTATPRSPG